ncbi:hypothetical protein [Streptomyces turgidiscabies]|uniref:hypothetical protein n=1 Tax=Streptomyces turgidiscabies TaxID=85558 RepID=UPI0038F76679
MNLFFDALPELLGTLAAAVVVGGFSEGVRRLRQRRLAAPAYTALGLKAYVAEARGARFRPAPAVAVAKAPVVRRYTLLGSTTADGREAQITSTRLAGSTLLHVVGGRAERFELTDVRLHDGTYAAEPVDRYL